MAFTSVPSVLVIQLKRFELNFETFSMEKIYKKYEFPTELDVAPYFRPSAGVSAAFDLYAYGIVGINVKRSFFSNISTPSYS